MTQIDGATALVTGGNRGIGRAIVDALLERGAATVYATSRSPHTHEDPRVVPLLVDITDPASVADAARAATGVSILVNNAGTNHGALILEGPLDGLHADLETNLLGLVHVTRAFAPALTGHPRSAVLNVLSAASWFAFGQGYDASKAAAWSATNSLRGALGPQGVTVTGLHVGLVDTDLTAGFDAPKADPRDVARQAVEGIADGVDEVLADDAAREAKAALSGPASALSLTLAAA